MTNLSVICLLFHNFLYNILIKAANLQKGEHMHSDLFFVLGIVLLTNIYTMVFGIALIGFATYMRVTKTKKHDAITY